MAAGAAGAADPGEVLGRGFLELAFDGRAAAGFPIPPPIADGEPGASSADTVGPSAALGAGSLSAETGGDAVALCVGAVAVLAGGAGG